MALKPKPNRSNESFEKNQGVVHNEFLPQGRTVNTESYLEVMRRLREAIRQKRTELYHGFCTLIMHQLTHRCLCVSFWPKTKISAGIRYLKYNEKYFSIISFQQISHMNLESK